MHRATTSARARTTRTTTISSRRPRNVFLLVALLIAIAIATALGGKPTRLAHVHLQAIPLVVLAAVSTKLVFTTGIYHTRPVLGPSLWLLGFVAGGVFL